MNSGHLNLQPHYLVIDLILASAAGVVAAVVRNIPMANDIVAVIGAILATVIVILEARKKDRTLANTITLFIGSSLIGSITPGALFYNVWPERAESFTWHIWISLGFAAGLIGWLIVAGIWNFVIRRRDAFIAAAAKRWLPTEPPDVEDDLPRK